MTRPIALIAAIAVTLVLHGCAVYTRPYGRSVAYYGGYGTYYGPSFGFNYGYWPYYYRPYRYRYPSYYRPYSYYGRNYRGNFGWRGGRDWSHRRYHRRGISPQGSRRGGGVWLGPRGSGRSGRSGQRRR